MRSDSKWGNPFENQVEATFYGPFEKEIDIPERRILGWVISKARRETVSRCGNLSTANGDMIPDDARADRKFKFRCGLIKAINVVDPDSTTRLILYLDGFPNVELNIVCTAFNFDPNLEGDPVVDILFSGSCPRKGGIDYGETNFATLVFKDRDQLGRFVNLVPMTRI